MSIRATDLHSESEGLEVVLLKRFPIERDVRQALFSVRKQGSYQAFVEVKISLDLIVMVMGVMMVMLRSAVVDKVVATIHHDAEFLPHIRSI